MSGENTQGESSDSGRLEIDVEIQKSFISKLVLRIREAENCSACRHNECCHGDHQPSWNKREAVPVNEEVDDRRRDPYELARSPAARVLKFVEPKKKKETKETEEA